MMFKFSADFALQLIGAATSEGTLFIKCDKFGLNLTHRGFNLRCPTMKTQRLHNVFSHIKFEIANIVK
jgi:hypothetical protein